MTIRAVVRNNTYYDSVSLMSITTRANDIDGINRAFVAMGTEINKEVMRNVGLMSPELEQAGNADLMIVIDADDSAALEPILAQVDGLFDRGATEIGQQSDATYKTLDAALASDPDANLAVISVAGAFAVREARSALRKGLHVLMFSDNVDISDEVALKQLAHDKGLLMMGPDCGTAILNGIAFCFANVIRPGSIGIVGASGTGSQEISVRVDDFNGGVSQLIGVGGRDLSEPVGGIMMIDAIRSLDADPATEVIVLISKPPAPSVETKVLGEIAGCGKPVVVCFIGGREQAVAQAGGIFARSTKEAALAAVLQTGVRKEDLDLHALNWPLIEEVRSRLGREQRFIRGLFCGGTLCDEAMYAAREVYDDVYSNISNEPGHHLTAGGASRAHTFLDFGDDDFTNGRPHPMIDPSTRIERFAREARDREVGVIVLDFILGYGAHHDPVGVLLPHILEAKTEASAAGRHLEVLAYVLGTPLDRQGLLAQVKRLEDAGVTIASSSTNAGLLAREFVRKDA